MKKILEDFVREKETTKLNNKQEIRERERERERE